ncbi:hypothetical protein ACHAPC_005676 [Botrytis cinerea]
MKTYIKRIEQVNSIIHAVSEINRKAIDIAREKDEERSRGLAQGSLHGVPILIKNLLFTTDGLKITLGCTAFLEAIPSIEATIIMKLREQGAIILGVANGSQWANNRCTPGWSAVGGQCLGVYHKVQHPKGSSSGSAVGTALGLCAVALGSETSGSVILPAQRSAVIGMKPTVGMISRYGMYISSDNQDTVGILARSVKDAALVLTVIADVETALSYFSINPHSLYTLSDVIAYTIATPAEEAMKRGLGHFESALEVGKNYIKDSEEYKNSLTERNHMGRQIPKLLDKFECDMIVLPTNVAVEPADVGGCPVVSVPMGFYPPGTEIVRQSGMVEVGPGIP